MSERGAGTAPAGAPVAPVTPVAGGQGPGPGQGAGAAPGTDRRGVIGMALVLVFWSLGPALSKRVGTPPLVTVFYRMWGAAALHWIVATVIGRRPSRETLRRCVFPGMCFAGNLVAFFYALQHASVANVTLISSLQPVVVLFVAGPLFGEQLRLWDVAWTVVALGGACVAVLGSNAQHGGVPTTALGVLLSTAGLFTFVGYFLFSKRVSTASTGRPAMHPLTYMTGIVTTAALVVTPLTLMVGGPASLGRVRHADVVNIALIIVVPSAGHLAMTWTHRHLAVSVSSLAMLIQPITAALCSWVINGQPVVAWQGVGAVIVVGSLAAVLARRST